MSGERELQITLHTPSVADILSTRSDWDDGVEELVREYLTKHQSSDGGELELGEHKGSVVRVTVLRLEDLGFEEHASTLDVFGAGTDRNLVDCPFTLPFLLILTGYGRKILLNGETAAFYMNVLRGYVVLTLTRDDSGDLRIGLHPANESDMQPVNVRWVFLRP